MRILALFAVLLSFTAQAKEFKNSYVSFEVPDTWTCAQEGVAWTCTPQGPVDSKEAVIVLAAKVAGPEDNLINFKTYLEAPKKLPTKVGTPMPSKVMYAQERMLAQTKWVQAQHLGSEIQEFYTLYLATVKDQLAILVSFSAERNRYAKYNPVFDSAIKSLKIVANQQLLFPKGKLAQGETIGIVTGGPTDASDMLPPPPRKKSGFTFILIVLGIVIAGAAVYFTKRKKSKPTKK